MQLDKVNNNKNIGMMVETCHVEDEIKSQKMDKVTHKMTASAVMNWSRQYRDSKQV